MDVGSRDTLLTLATAVLWLVGIAAIIYGDLLLAVAGIALITVSTIVFLVDAKDLLVRADEQHSGK